MNATADSIPIVRGPEGYENHWSLWKVTTRVYFSDINGIPKDPFIKEWNIVAMEPQGAVPQLYTKYSKDIPRHVDPSSQKWGLVIVSKIEILSIEWLNQVDIAPEV